MNRFDIRNISNLQGVHQCLVALLISMSPTTNIITNINIDDQCKIPNLKYQGKIRSTRLCHENIKVVVITLTGGAKTNRTRKKEIDHTCYPAFAYKYVYFLLSVCIYCDRICIICDHICMYCKHISIVTIFVFLFTWGIKINCTSMRVALSCNPMDLLSIHLALYSTFISSSLRFVFLSYFLSF